MGWLKIPSIFYHKQPFSVKLFPPAKCKRKINILLFYFPSFYGTIEKNEKDLTALKKPNMKQLALGLRFAAMIVLVVWSTYCCSPRRGFLSTLPLIPPACLISSFLYYSPKYTVLLAAFCSFSFTLADGSGMGYAVVIALFCAFSAWISVLASKQLALCFRTRRLLPLFLALLLLCPAPLIQAALFSTPWSNRTVQGQWEEYLQTQYPDQEFTEVRTYYNVRNRSYEALVRFPGGQDAILEETLVQKDGAVREDGFFTRFCQKGLEQRQSEYVTLIRSAYPDQRLWLDCSKTTLSFDSSDSFSGSYGAVPQWLEDSTALELGFQFTISDNKSFLNYVKEYLAYLNQSEFSYGQIRFFGGDQGVYLYTLTATPDTKPEELASLIRSCKISMNIPSISLEYSYLF